MPLSGFNTPLPSGVKSPIILTGNVDPAWQTYDDYYVKLILKIEEPYRSGNFVEVDLDIHARPNPENKIRFNLARLLEGRLGFDKPDLDGVPLASIAENLSRRYQIRLEEIKNGDFSSSITSIYIHAYLAGFKHYKQEISNYLLEKKFLTHQPLTKTITEHQPEFLYFIAPANATYHLTADLYHQDDSTTVGHLPGISVTAEEGDVMIFPAGFLQLGFNSIGPPVVKYDLYLNNNYSEVRTYELDCHYSSIERYYLMANSLGGFDTVRTSGELKVKDETKGQRVEKADGVFSDGSTRSYQDVNRRIQEVCTQHTGHLTREENFWLKDLLLSEDAYRIGDYHPNLEANGELVPIVIETGGTDRYQDQEFLYGFPFSYREAFDSRGI